MDELNSHFLKARLQGIISSIENEDSRARTERISWSLATDFNKILEQFCEAYPDHKDSFPGGISGSHGRKLGVADASFLDLRVKAEQVVKVIELLTEGA
ncbi:MAG: hypothetical protein CME33_19705 [Gimesia sp.]|uniref:hypothetical protein n=1 Tax=Gimesia sp. TaxID=2024833 RepID=UPI000C52FA70|nr:hypothetical protein [Gimesia sp.]MAX38789.1 hypothetical protein [Gimesia sp.]|tara:strand:- start:487 stop:783 length:297 start_codon:yes stop_codon:yes gene_type:complete